MLPRKRYYCKKGCLYNGRVFETDRLSNWKEHEKTKKHSIGRSSEDKTTTELTHEKEAKLGRHSFVDEVIKDNFHLYF